MASLNMLSAVEVAAAISAGSITSEELTAACISRIREREEDVGAWQYIDHEAALSAARACDAGPSRGPLHGVPVGVKDNFDTVDMPTGYGSEIYKDHRPVWDAACVALLKAAGAIILGKTVTSEFAAYTWGKTRNPLDLSLTTGISSMGSAAAVADHMVPAALGSQTSGSILRPASFCGVVGYKPSYGLFNRSGMRPLAESLDTAGFFTRSVADIALFSAVLADEPYRPLSPLDSAPRIGVCATHSWDMASPAAQTAFVEARGRISATNTKVVEIILPEPFAGLNDALVTVLQYEAARAFAYEYAERRSSLSVNFRNLVEQGRACTRERYEAAQDLGRRCGEQIAAIFKEVDVIMTLGAECEPRPASDPVGNSVFNRLWTMLRLPCVNLPLMRSARGLPIGIQLVGPAGQDGHLLSCADWINARFAR